MFGYRNRSKVFAHEISFSSCTEHPGNVKEHFVPKPSLGLWRLKAETFHKYVMSFFNPVLLVDSTVLNESVRIN